MHIRLTETKLSDGSRGYDVALIAMQIPCVTFADAAEFVEKIRAAVEAHTNDDVSYEECQA